MVLIQMTPYYSNTGIMADFVLHVYDFVLFYDLETIKCTLMITGVCMIYRTVIVSHCIVYIALIKCIQTAFIIILFFLTQM